ncbi:MULTISPECIES: MMPL family transporter [unclassified Streptomyces]|uniref:MMPL family transporter n=1 Tax=unclassified Streptomyces TaxID=2593676 RepID=UPI0036E34155
MSSLLHRLGRSSARHPWRVLTGWLLVICAVFGIAGAGGGSDYIDQFKVPGSDSTRAQEVLEKEFPEASGTSVIVVYHAEEGRLDTPERRAAVAEASHKAQALNHVVAAPDPLTPGAGSLSEDGRTAHTTVTYGAPLDELGEKDFEALEEANAAAEHAGVELSYEGALVDNSTEQESMSELIGLIAAMVILLVSFGTFVAMGLPILTALLGLALGSGGNILLSQLTTIGSAAPTVATMIGLGVGIDYALFLVTRHRTNLDNGMDPEESAGHALATAGQALVFAGFTVVIALMGLQIVGIPYVGSFGYTSALVVTVMVAAAITLLPALLGLLGHRINRLRVLKLRPAPNGSAFWRRWATAVTRRPKTAVAASLVLMGLLAFPALDMRLGQPDNGTKNVDATQRIAYDHLAEAFGPGFNGPLTISLSTPDRASLESTGADVVKALRQDPGIATVGTPVPNQKGTTAIVTAVPTTSPQDEATSELVDRIRADVLPGAVDGARGEAHVTGPTAANIDMADRISERLVLFIGAVVGISLLLLVFAFRSLWVPVKAAVLNVLSVFASYGAVVTVFQNGHGSKLIGLDGTVPIISFVPMMLFAILFGLSMDYEVFVVSRIREEYARTKNASASVVEGVAHTGRVVSAAAIIMVTVFGCFVIGDDPIIKMFGLGLSLAVALDAFVVRLVLVPALMKLMGDASWKLPRRLDRLLPHVDLEGGRHGADAEPRQAPPAVGPDRAGEPTDEDFAPVG